MAHDIVVADVPLRRKIRVRWMRAETEGTSVRLVVARGHPWKHARRRRGKRVQFIVEAVEYSRVSYMVSGRINDGKEFSL